MIQTQKRSCFIGRNEPEILKVRAFRNVVTWITMAHKLSIGWTICGHRCVDRHGGPVHVLSRRTVYDDMQRPFRICGKAGRTTTNLDTGKQDMSKSAFVAATQHQFAPCSNNFFVKDPFFGPWHETHVF